MSRPRLLDLFCGAGGCSVGYARAGFEVVGVDIAPQPHYPFAFHQADAMTFPLAGFDAIHASPPCQGYTRCRHIRRGLDGPRPHPLLVKPIRDRLEAWGGAWVIENVCEAAPDLPDAIVLCGTSFGLRVQRHRLFSSNQFLFSAGSCWHRTGDVSVRRQHADFTGMWREGISYQSKGRTRPRPVNASKADAECAMGIDWMTFAELGEAIPPAYTDWIGRQLRAALGGESAA